MRKSRVVLLGLTCLALGIVIGGNLFSKTQPRSFIALRHCDNCMSVADLAGLLASVGIQNIPGGIPLAEVETDKTVAFKLPTVRGVHYVIVPKKDIKNVADLSEADSAYLTDAYLVARRLIERDRLSKYRFYTNGPGIQNVTYLHFHLIARLPSSTR
jgi:hypothetical protein